MTPEQQKLIQHLIQMGDITIFNRKKETVVKAIKEMDMVSLELILDENLTYQETSKEIFLSKLFNIFKEFKKSKDTLQTHSGKCGSKDCSNYDKNGILFCGKKTGKHFNLLIEEDENENVKDLCYCSSFRCNFEENVNKNGQSIDLFVYEDEKAKFRPSSHYEYINKKSIEAISDLSIFENKSISKVELFDWIDKYSDFYASKPIFDFRYKNEHKFYQTYRRVNDLKKYLELEDECAKAVKLFDTLIEDNEHNLIKWLAEHENLKDKLILFCPDYVDEETNRSQKVIVNFELNISISKDYLNNCIRFQDLIDTHYYIMFDKIKIVKGEQNDFTPFDDDIEKHTSLKYHLEQRNLLVEKINYKTKLGKNSFLYVNDGLGKLDEGIN